MDFTRSCGAGKVVRLLVVALAATGAIFSMGGCVSENLEACRSVLRLSFYYTHNNSRKDLLADHVRSADVYVFDRQTGVLKEIVAIGPDDMAIGRRDIPSLPAGTYTMVAWGSSNEAMTRSYSGRQMVDAARHEHTGIEVGQTTIDDLYMMLATEPAPATVEGDLVPATPYFDDLFYAVAEEVEVVEDKNRVIRFDFWRNTSLLRIAVTGLEHFDDPNDPGGFPLRLFATGENGRYGRDNSIDRHAPTVHYASLGGLRTGNGLALNIPMQRLHIERHSDDPVLLHIQRLTGATPGAIPGIPPIDLVAAIKSSTDGLGNYPYPDQEAIDREHEFRITLALSPDPDHMGYFRLTVTINEWMVVIVDPDVGKPATS